MPSDPLPLAQAAILLDASDDVAVARMTLEKGTRLTHEDGVIVLQNRIEPGHKFALRAIPAGSPVRKYGEVIGLALGAIAPGEHVHTHNLGARDFERAPSSDAPVVLSSRRPVVPWSRGPVVPVTLTFPGFLRPDGRVGTRNYIAVISSVNCSAGVSRRVAEHFPLERLHRDFPNVDGVIAFTHKSGCSVQPGEPFDMLTRVLVGMARHPNVFGCVMIGLGCEGHSVAGLCEAGCLGRSMPGGVAPIILTIQEQGGVRKSVEAGMAAVECLLPLANAAVRTPQPFSKLVLALNCGGSDGASGITANPALGQASDELVRHGGTSVLGETPEIYGAEHLLLRRAVDHAVAERLMERIRWWEEHVRLHGASIDNNPSPGNKAGGLTTIHEKSLGALSKGGHAPLSAVVRYAEPVKGPGLVFMDTPGFDPVSMTGLVSGGCTIGVFTTGRGSVYGCKPSPCIKVATNTALFERMGEDMDLNAGTILDGTENVEQAGARIFEEIVAVAGGKRTKSELQNLGDDEFAPWILGPTF